MLSPLPICHLNCVFELSLVLLKQNALDYCLNSGTPWKKNFGISNKFKLDGRPKGVETSGEMASDCWHCTANLFSQHCCRVLLCTYLNVHIWNYMHTFLMILWRRVESDKTYKSCQWRTLSCPFFPSLPLCSWNYTLFPVPSLWSDT